MISGASGRGACEALGLRERDSTGEAFDWTIQTSVSACGMWQRSAFAMAVATKCSQISAVPEKPADNLASEFSAGLDPLC